MKKPVQTKLPEKPFSWGLKKISKMFTGNMSEEVRMFEIARDKPPEQKPPEPKTDFITARPRENPPVETAFEGGSDAAAANAQRKYWEKKLQELTLENIKLQEKLAEITKSRDHFVAEQLEPAKASAKAAEAAYHAEAAKAKQLQEELVKMRQAREQLNAKLAEDQDAVARSQQVQEELGRLRQMREQLTARLTEKERDAAISARRSEALEEQLSKSSAELTRVKAALQKRLSEQGSMQFGLSEDLASARGALEKSESACREQMARSNRFEAELDRLRLARAELTGKVAEHEQAATEFRKRNDELDRRLANSAAELERVKAELNQHIVGRAAVGAQLREKVEAAKASAERLQTVYREQTSIFTGSKEELAALRRVRDELQARLNSEQHAAAEARRRSEDLEARLRESSSEIGRAKALEERLAEQASARSELSKQMDAPKNP